jgi:hypothetical protein
MRGGMGGCAAVAPRRRRRPHKPRRRVWAARRAAPHLVQRRHQVLGGAARQAHGQLVIAHAEHALGRATGDYPRSGAGSGRRGGTRMRFRGGAASFRRARSRRTLPPAAQLVQGAKMSTGALAIDGERVSGACARGVRGAEGCGAAPPAPRTRPPAPPAACAAPSHAPLPLPRYVRPPIPQARTFARRMVRERRWRARHGAARGAARGAPPNRWCGRPPARPGLSPPPAAACPRPASPAPQSWRAWPWPTS